MIQGIVFDLDGTLINSEPLWQEAETISFSEQGLNLTPEDCLKTKGLPTSDTVQYWYNKINKPTKEIALLTQEISQKVIVLIKEKGELMPGAIEILEYWKNKNLPIGIASASSMAHIKTVVDKFELKEYFNLIYSGDFEEHGKPHPGIYISACNKLKINPIFSISVEDSFNGILSAKSARMKTVALLNKSQINDSTYNFADLKIESLKNFGDKEFDYLNSLL